MTTSRKIFIIKILLGIIFFLGICVYFVGGVSATFPPIRTYNCIETPGQFETAVKELTKSDTSITYNITNVVGDHNTGYATYMTLFVKTPKRTIEYEVKYEKEEAVTKVGLIFAYDRARNLGGYGIKASGMSALLDTFEKNFLVRLKAEQKISLKQDTSYWANHSIY